MDEKEIQYLVGATIASYIEHATAYPWNTEYLDKMQWEFKDMAKGGDGGLEHPLGDATVRRRSYPLMPDYFFQEVCDLMGWK